MNKLQQLWLSDNQINDVTPLALLANLQRLRLKGNPNLGDTSPLANLKKLTDVDVEITKPKVIQFPDAALATAIRTELGLQANEDITATAMLGLTTLIATNSGISDLTGLEHIKNLQSLFLENNQISGIQSLTQLNQLQEVHLYNNQINDIQPLAQLKQLRILSLYNNQINDIQPLTQLNKLQRLYLSDNQISDLQPLAQLKQLQDLELHNNQVSDVTPLAQLVNLQRLRLKGNTNLGDTSPLATLKKLTDVDVEITQPKAPEVITFPDAALASAIRTALGLQANADITPQAILELTELRAEESGISDLTGLEHATNLQRLDLFSNQIRRYHVHRKTDKTTYAGSV